MNNGKSDLGSLITALLCAGAFVFFLIVAFDPPYNKETTVPGIIIGNIQQVGDSKNPEESVQVELKNGVVVNAKVSPVSGFPFKIGTYVEVTQYRSMVFGKHTYRASVGSALTTQSRGPP